MEEDDGTIFMTERRSGFCAFFMSYRGLRVDIERLLRLGRRNDARGKKKISAGKKIRRFNSVTKLTLLRISPNDGLRLTMRFFGH
jgi:hypothetical protein